MACHLPFLVPLAGLLVFAVLPFPAALAVYLPLTALSLLVAVPTVRAMYAPTATGAAGMRGQPAVVITAEDRSGLLRLDGELWRYVAPEPLEPGAPVEIVAIEGLTAVVRPRTPARRPALEGGTR